MARKCSMEGREWKLFNHFPNKKHKSGFETLKEASLFFGVSIQTLKKTAKKMGKKFESQLILVDEG